VRTPLCGKCDVIFSYSYTNSTKLVFYLSCLVRLAAFQMLSMMSHCFKIPILSEICIKMRYFYWKIAKLAQHWGLRPLTPLPPAAGGFAPRPPANPPNWEFLATPLDSHNYTTLNKQFHWFAACLLHLVRYSVFIRFYLIGPRVSDSLFFSLFASNLLWVTDFASIQHLYYVDTKIILCH